MFNSDRRFYEKLQDTGTYLDSVAGSEVPTGIYTVEDDALRKPLPDPVWWLAGLPRR